MMMRKILMFFLCGAVMLGCTSIEPVTVDISATPKVDEKNASAIEQYFGKTGYYYLTLNYKLDNSPTVYHRLNKLGTRISKYCERSELEYQYIVVDSQFHFAYSFPPANIVFSRAIIEDLKSDANIAAVLAHEIAHINHKHGIYFYEQRYGKNAKEISGEKVISLATQLGYNRAFELQADETGMKYLQRAGFDPVSFTEMLGLLDGFEKSDIALSKNLNIKEDRRQRNLDKYMQMSYPALSTRIVNSRSLAEQIKKNEKVLYNPNDFQF